MNKMLHSATSRMLHACYAMFDFALITFANGLPYPVRCTDGKAQQIPLPGIPLGSFGGSTYDEVTQELKAGDVFVFCSDGISEAFDEAGQEFGSERLMSVIEKNSTRTAKEIVGEVFGAVQAFCGDAPQSDDRTVVVVKVER